MRIDRGRLGPWEQVIDNSRAWILPPGPLSYRHDVNLNPAPADTPGPGCRRHASQLGRAGAVSDHACGPGRGRARAVTRPKAWTSADQGAAAGPPVVVYRWVQALLDDPDVGRHLLLVILVAGKYADHKTGKNIRPGAPRLAEDTGLGESTVRRHLATAVALGYLALVQRGGGSGDGRHWANQYRCTLPPGSASTDLAEVTEDRPQAALPLDPGPSTARSGSLHRSLEGGHLLTSISSTSSAGDFAALAALDFEPEPEPEFGWRRPQARPSWCGQCDQASRMWNQVRIDEQDRGGKPYHCPTCHPDQGGHR